MTGALASLIIASREGATVNWPASLDVIKGVAAGWLILTVWALFGVLLATLSRGIALAMGLGIVYGLVIEGLVTGFGTSMRVLHDLSEAFLRTNAYSLIAPLQTKQISNSGGPGFFDGPFVSEWQALLVIVSYLLVFAGLSALLLQRRDVS